MMVKMKECYLRVLAPQHEEYLKGKNINEPPHKKTSNMHKAKTKVQVSCAVTAPYRKYTSSSLIPNFKLLAFCDYSLVCLGPGQKCKLLVFSCDGSFLTQNRMSHSIRKLSMPVKGTLHGQTKTGSTDMDG